MREVKNYFYSNGLEAIRMVPLEIKKIGPAVTRIFRAQIQKYHYNKKVGQVKKGVTMGFLKTCGKPPDRFKRRWAA